MDPPNEKVCAPEPPSERLKICVVIGVGRSMDRLDVGLGGSPMLLAIVIGCVGKLLGSLKPAATATSPADDVALESSMYASIWLRLLESVMEPMELADTP